MAISVVQIVTTSGLISSAPYQIPSATYSSGHTIVVLWTARTTFTLTSVTDGGSNTYTATPKTIYQPGATGNQSLGIHVAKNISGFTGNITANFSVAPDNYWTGTAYEISGADTATPLSDDEVGTGATGTTLTTGSNVAVTRSSIILAIGHALDVLTQGTGYTGQWTGGNVFTMDEYKAVSASESPTMTQGSSGGWLILAASIQSPGAAGNLFLDNRLTGLGAGGPFFRNPLTKDMQ